MDEENLRADTGEATFAIVSNDFFTVVWFFTGKSSVWANKYSDLLLTCFGMLKYRSSRGSLPTPVKNCESVPVH